MLTKGSGTPGHTRVRPHPGLAFDKSARLRADHPRCAQTHLGKKEMAATRLGANRYPEELRSLLRLSVLAARSQARYKAPGNLARANASRRCQCPRRNRSGP